MRTGRPADLDALVAGDIEAIRDSFAHDATWTIHGDLPIAGPWKGRDRIVDDFLTTVGSSLFEPGSHAFEFSTLLADGNTVALEWRVQARSAKGVEYDNNYCASSWFAKTRSKRCGSTWTRAMQPRRCLVRNTTGRGRSARAVRLERDGHPLVDHTCNSDVLRQS
jgi:ketosteroid isomerase-like protein